MIGHARTSEKAIRRVRALRRWHMGLLLFVPALAVTRKLAPDLERLAAAGGGKTIAITVLSVGYFLAACIVGFLLWTTRCPLREAPLRPETWKRRWSIHPTCANCGFDPVEGSH